MLSVSIYRKTTATDVIIPKYSCHPPEHKHAAVRYLLNRMNTFYYQLTHKTLKNVELLKHSKINKNAPTCFGLQGNHLQGAKISTWLTVDM